MNVIFAAVMILSSAALCLFSPESLLPAMLDGALDAAKCALTLFCVYAVWMGLSAVAEDCGITAKIAKMLSPVCTKFFRTDDKEAAEAISMNISCNLLGIGGAATPYGVKAIGRLEKEGNEFAQNLLFIINSTSIQLIPTTVIALRAAAGSAAAYDIFLPSLIATAISTGSAALLYIFADKLKRKRQKRAGRRS